MKPMKSKVLIWLVVIVAIFAVACGSQQSSAPVTTDGGNGSALTQPVVDTPIDKEPLSAVQKHDATNGGVKVTEPVASTKPVAPAVEAYPDEAAPYQETRPSPLAVPDPEPAPNVIALAAPEPEDIAPADEPSQIIEIAPDDTAVDEPVAQVEQFSPLGENFFLKLVSPIEDTSFVESETFDVSGLTVVDAMVSVNDDLIDVNQNGEFQATVELEEGPNIIEVVASNQSGDEEYVVLTVFYLPEEGS